jgi:hypothetical protein
MISNYNIVRAKETHPLVGKKTIDYSIQQKVSI